MTWDLSNLLAYVFMRLRLNLGLWTTDWTWRLNAIYFHSTSQKDMVLRFLRCNNNMSRGMRLIVSFYVRPLSYAAILIRTLRAMPIGDNFSTKRLSFIFSKTLPRSVKLTSSCVDLIEKIKRLITNCFLLTKIL